MPVKGDWATQTKEDLQMVGMLLTKKDIAVLTKVQYKTLARKHVKDDAFKKLKEKQESHIKKSHLRFHEHKMQSYFKTHMLNNHEASLLFSLRSKSTREFKANLPYNPDQMCVMGFAELDTPQHCLECDKVLNYETQDTDIVYNDIFSESLSKQAAATKLFATLLERREGGRVPVPHLLVPVIAWFRAMTAVNHVDMYIFSFICY